MTDGEADIDAKKKWGPTVTARSMTSPRVTGPIYKIFTNQKTVTEEGNHILGASNVSWEEAFARAIAAYPPTP